VGAAAPADSRGGAAQHRHLPIPPAGRRLAGHESHPPVGVRGRVVEALTRIGLGLLIEKCVVWCHHLRQGHSGMLALFTNCGRAILMRLKRYMGTCTPLSSTVLEIPPLPKAQRLCCRPGSPPFSTPPTNHRPYTHQQPANRNTLGMEFPPVAIIKTSHILTGPSLYMYSWAGRGNGPETPRRHDLYTMYLHTYSPINYMQHSGRVDIDEPRRPQQPRRTSGGGVPAGTGNVPLPYGSGTIQRPGTGRTCGSSRPGTCSCFYYPDFPPSRPASSAHLPISIATTMIKQSLWGSISSLRSHH
jgi:hypothetical protein